jgi:O-antigen ligase
MKKILEYGIYLLVFLLPWQTRWIIKAGNLNGYSEYNTYSLYGTEIILWTITLISLFYLIKNENLRFTIYDLRFKILIFLFLIFSFISAVLAFNPALAFYTLLKIAEGGILAFLIYKLANFKKIIYAFSGGMLIQASVAFWQFFTQTSFSSKWLGMALQNASILGASVVETGSGRWLRAYGALPHPNILAGYLVIAIFLLAILYVHKESKLVFPAIIILSSALFLTFSRAAWIALIFCLLIFLLANLKNKTNLKKIASITIVCATIPLILSFIYTPLLKTRVEGVARLEEKSNAERMQFYRESFKIIKLHPVFGVGPGNYTLALKNEINPNLKSFAYQPTHNIYLLFISKFGILAFLFLMILFIIYNLKLKIIFLSPILILGLFDHYPISIYAGIMLVGFVVGLSCLANKTKT